MNYTNGTMRMDQMVGYLAGDKINLSPVFQRGHVWKTPSRKKLVRNIVMGRPIPAIFIYKEQSGPKVFYNILDGKQRLESVILFITDRGNTLTIPGWAKFFLIPRIAGMLGFQSICQRARESSLI